MKNRIIRSLIIALLFGAVSVVSAELFTDSAFAGSGSGSDGDACQSGCGDPQWWGVYPDSNHKGRGGISWKAFRTKPSYYTKYKLYNTSYDTGPTYCRDRSDMETGSGCSIIKGLSGGGYDKKLALTCAQANYDWYLVLAFDGWKEKDWSKTRYFGPSAMNATYGDDNIKFYSGSRIQTHNQLALGTVLSALATNTLAEGSRVDLSTVKHFCAQDNTGLCAGYSGGTLPGTLGYVCVNSEQFEGRVDATGTTGSFVQSSQPTRYSTVGCTVDGCNATFTHYVRRKTGGGNAVSFNIYRSSNLTDNTLGKAVSSGYINSGSTQGFTWFDTVRMYPGMTVCETLTFQIYPSRGDTAAIPVCVFATGNAQPPDPNPDTPEEPSTPSGDTSFINIKVKNDDLSKYNKYQREVYAKPNDHVSYRSVYNPILQYTYYLRPDAVQFDGGSVIAGSNRSFPAIFTAAGRTWRNAFSMQLQKDINKDECISYSANQKFDESARCGAIGFTRNKLSTNGSPERVREEDLNRRVDESDGGSSLNERAITNLNGDTTTTPGQITFRQYGSSNLGNVDTSRKFNIAYARIPYNFINKTEPVQNNPDDPVFAGEDETFVFDITTLPRYNEVTEGDYATIVRDAKWKLRVTVNNDSIYETDPAKNTLGEDTIGDLNAQAKKEGDTVTKRVTINIPDVYAGSDICIQTAVYPKTSGDFKNWSDKEGDHLWSDWSSLKCFKVAKRPSIQTWGGNVFSRGSMITSTSIKGHLNGYNDYAIEKKDYAKTLFGSWNELGVVANSGVLGFGSGASMGYARNDGENNTWPKYKYESGGETIAYNGVGNTAAGGDSGGSKKTSFCDRIPLTIPNADCSGSITVGLSSAIGVTQAANDKDSIIEVLGLGGENMSGEINSGRIGTISGGDTKAVGSKDGDVTITSNLIYFDQGGSYRSYHDMPKLIIYAKNIKISCDVERIDALLIAEDEVDTCAEANKDNVNERFRSRQLFINGAVIANKLHANRTYGAATGANSIIPAEIINFDPTLYEFGNSSESDDNVTGRLDVTYIHEVSPRL